MTSKIRVLKNITIAGMAIKVKEIPAPDSSNMGYFEPLDNTPTVTPGQLFTVDENTALQIQLVNSVEEICNPQIAYSQGEQNRWFYLKVESWGGANLKIFTSQHGWKIYQTKGCVLSRWLFPSEKPLFARLLPSKLNVWPVRIILFPIALAYYAVKYVAKFAQSALMSLFNVKDGQPENINLEVGDDGDG